MTQSAEIVNSVDNLDKRYGDKLAVDGGGFEVRRGEISVSSGQTEPARP